VRRLMWKWRRRRRRNVENEKEVRESCECEAVGLLYCRFYILTRIGHSFWTGNVSHLMGLVVIFFSSDLVETSQPTKRILMLIIKLHKGWTETVRLNLKFQGKRDQGKNE